MEDSYEDINNFDNNNLDDIFNDLDKQYNEYIDLEEKENFKKIFYDPDKLQNIKLNKIQLERAKNMININSTINNQIINKKSD